MSSYGYLKDMKRLSKIMDRKKKLGLKLKRTIQLERQASIKKSMVRVIEEEAATMKVAEQKQHSGDTQVPVYVFI